MHTLNREITPGGKQILLLEGPACKQNVCIDLAGASFAPEGVSVCCRASASDLIRARIACAQHDLGRTAAKLGGMVRHMMEQPGMAELREELKDFKHRAEAQINSVTSELAIVKNCIMQLYNVLLPSKFPMQHPQVGQPCWQIHLLDYPQLFEVYAWGVCST